jgi:hypothetical protein
MIRMNYDYYRRRFLCFFMILYDGVFWFYFQIIQETRLAMSWSGNLREG